MNMLVCIKQVPDTTEIKIDPVTNTLIRDGVPSIVNPFDADALEVAARIRDKNNGCKIVALSMGPMQAKNALKECLGIAADKAYLVSDRVFGGSDTLATSYILSKAIAKVEEAEGKFDIIFCGKQAIDGDTAQVGPEIAEHMGYPQITCALDVIVETEWIKARREGDDGQHIIGIKPPCVITITKPSFSPRFQTIKRMLAANKTEIPVISVADLPEINLAYLGLKGSPTKVKKTFVPERKKGGIKISGVSGEAAAKKLFNLLSEAKII